MLISLYVVFQFLFIITFILIKNFFVQGPFSLFVNLIKGLYFLKNWQCFCWPNPYRIVDNCSPLVHFLCECFGPIYILFFSNFFGSFLWLFNLQFKNRYLNYSTDEPQLFEYVYFLDYYFKYYSEKFDLPSLLSDFTLRYLHYL